MITCQILAETLDPFSGLLYVQPGQVLRRGQQGPGHCRAEGRGRHQLQVTVGVGQCGWKRKGETVRLSVYMQYDPHVQQVIDEQLEVECNMASRLGRVVETSQLDRQHTSIPVTAVQSFGVATTILSEEEEQEEQEEIRKEEVEREEEPAPPPSLRQKAERRILEETDNIAAGWLDITSNGRQVREPLLEGDAVKLSAKVKMTGRQETMVTRCLMATARGDIIELTDEFGCSADTSLVTDFNSINNDITGVRESLADFFVPRMTSGRKMESVKIKCNLVLCERRCPMISCGGQNKPIKARDSLVLETQALITRDEMINVLEHRDDSHVSQSLLTIDDSTLCLSPTRLVLAFGVLIVVIIISLLFSCYLWMKARKRMMPRPPMPIQRVPYMMPNRARPYIRVMT